VSLVGLAGPFYLNQLGTAAKEQNFRPNNIKSALIIPLHNTRPLQWPNFFGERKKVFKKRNGFVQTFSHFLVL
jgi:hypothetical protein